MILKLAIVVCLVSRAMANHCGCLANEPQYESECESGSAERSTPQGCQHSDEKCFWVSVEECIKDHNEATGQNTGSE